MEEQTFQIGVKALIANNRGEILLVKATPDRVDGKWPVHWDIPGGRIKNETPTETLRREVEEEIGVTDIDVVALFDAFASNIKIKDLHTLFLVVYVCKMDENAKITLSEEHSEYRWFKPRDAIDPLSYKYPSEFLAKLSAYKP